MIRANFTVLMSVYKNDDPLLFNRALISVFDNNILPERFILVVDGPVSEILDNVIINFEKSHGLSVIRLQKNVGLAHALNCGLQFITTEWVVRADADDININTRFSTLSRYMEPQFDIVGSWMTEYNENGEVSGERRTPVSHNDILRYIKKRNPFNHMTVAYRVAGVVAVGGYPDIYLREDYGLWIKMIANGAICRNIPQSLVDVSAGAGLYRRRGGIAYASGEFQLQRLLIKHGIKTVPEAIFDGVLRSLVYVSPGFLRKVFYTKLMRY